MNSFAMIFGHCAWIPPSSKAALVALSLFFGIGINSESDIAAGEAILASQYVSAGKTQIEAQKEVDSLNTCFRNLRGASRKQKSSQGCRPNASQKYTDADRQVADESGDIRGGSVPLSPAA
jgi:hypothetical protein